MLKIIFAGTPIFTRYVVDLLARDFFLAGVLTHPPRRQGRRMEMQDSDVFVVVEALKKEGILSSDIPIFTPERMDDAFISSIARLKPDLLVCFAYGKLFPKKMIDVFSLGGINIHPSLLPKWRGPSPIPFAIYSGDKQSGISIQTIKEKMDSGDILIQETFEIEKGETTDKVLSDKVATLSAKMLAKVLLNFDTYIKNAKVQNEEGVSYSRLLTKKDGLIDWNRSAVEIERQVLAFTSWPGTYTFCNGKKLNIIDAVAIDYDDGVFDTQTNACHGIVIGKKNDMGILVKTGKGVLCLRQLQWQTKKVLKWKDFLNGSPSFIGSLLS